MPFISTFAGGSSRGFKRSAAAAPVYTVTPVAFNINEGSALTINVGGSNITNGTYYFTINHITTVSGDFSASSGSVSITSNAGSFTITPTADVTTEGAQTFTVSLQTVLEGRPPIITTHATSETITVNDTSVTIQGLYSWGRGTNGALGLGNTTDYSSPKQVGALTTWSANLSNNYGGHVAAIKTDGTLWTWGYGSSGRLGLGNDTSYSSPKQVGALTTWSKISTTEKSCAAIKTNGTLWTWGYNSYGRLGLGDTTTRRSPVQIGALTDWSQVAIGFKAKHGLAVLTTGTLFSWGRNNNGQLGLGNTTDYSSPKQVPAGTTWSKVSSGADLSVAIAT